MTQEFYDRLEKMVKECEAHPYKSSEPMDFGNGWEGRVSKKHLGTWSEEDYDILYNFKDERVNKICKICHKTMAICNSIKLNHL